MIPHPAAISYRAAAVTPGCDAIKNRRRASYLDVKSRGC